MAVYKVIQDIEAEDKLLGPLTLKGLIYAGITVLFGFLNFQLITSGAPIFIKVPLLIVMSMPMALFGVLASPLGRDQPTEVWLLAHLKFFLKPRQRIWDQSGLSQLVTITAPKQIERMLTKGYSAIEVQSRLKALSTTLDSRGWIVKNVNINLNSQPDYVMSTEESSDRLITASTMTQEVPEIDVSANDDMLDENNNPTAQKFQSMMIQAEQKRKQDLENQIAAARTRAETEQVNTQNTLQSSTTYPDEAKKTKVPQPNPTPPEPPVEPLAVMGTTIVTPGRIVSLHDTGTSEGSSIGKEEQMLLDRIHARQATLDAVKAAPPPIVQIHGGKVINPAGTVTSASQTDKIRLAQSGNDFSVATVAKLANRSPGS